MIPPTEVVELPTPRPPNEEVIIEEDYARDRPNTLQVIQAIYAMTKEGLCDGDSVENFQGILRRIHDEMHPTTTLQITRRRMYWF